MKEKQTCCGWEVNPVPAAEGPWACALSCGPSSQSLNEVRAGEASPGRVLWSVQAPGPLEMAHQFSPSPVHPS